MTTRSAGDVSRNDVTITTELVLTTALEIVDHVGVEGLTMRRLAAALNRDPMVLYRHTPNKAAVLIGIAEIVLADLRVDPTDPDWAGQLRTVARAYRELALAHPKAAPLLITLPLATPLGLRPLSTLRPLENVLTLLIHAGFSATNALHIYRMLFGFLHGHIFNEIQELVEKPDEVDDVLRLGLYRLPINEFPTIRALAPALASYDGTLELERGIDILLNGFAAALAPATPAAT